MTTLAQLFCERSQSGASDPLEPAIVIVQSHGTAKWLKHQLAVSQGISANVEAVLPARFIWRLYQHLLNQPEHPPLGREFLVWRLMPILLDIPEPAFDPIRRYLDAPGDRFLRRYQLADRVADLFDQYLVWRPDWIQSWDAGKDPVVDNPFSWQPLLWKKLQDIEPELHGCHRAALHHELMELLLDPPEPGPVPSRISLFGLSSLPPMQLETFQALGRWIEVDIYFLNPCQHYWGDIVSERQLAKRTIRQIIGKTGPLLDEDYLEVGNPVLASMGKQGRDFSELLLGIDEIEIMDAFEEPAGHTRLALIQRDILNLETGGRFGSQPAETTFEIDPDDDSLQIHDCHSRLREVEVLFDQLMSVFTSHPDIKPGDVMVMMPDVTEYIPYIHQVFSNRIHFSIADSGQREHPALTASLFWLLGLQESRMTSTEVMDFLSNPAVARKLSLLPDDLEMLSRWITESGIRWETDGAEKQLRWQLPADHHHTWRFGLDRLLLGLALNTSDGLFEGVLPHGVDTGDMALLSALCGLIHRLEHFRTLMQQPCSAADWQNRIHQLIDEFYDVRDDEVLEISRLHSTLQMLVDETGAAGYRGDLSSQLIRHWLTHRLYETSASFGYLTGGVNFGTLVPMRSIPFRVVAVLGMNDGEFPRRDDSLSFNLLNVTPLRKGDRSRRAEDRYLFMEALLSAQTIFHISFVGRSLKDNHVKPPSVVVSELLDYIHDVFGDTPVHQHPLQPFSPRCFDGSGTVSWQKHWYEGLCASGHIPTFIDRELPAPESLRLESLAQLMRFFRDSARFFLQQRLGIYLETDLIDMPETEPFALDGLEKWQLADSALDSLQRGDDAQVWREAMIASGKVMNSPVGKRCLDEQIALAQSIHAGVSRFTTAAGRTWHGSLTINGSVVSGTLENLTDEYLLRPRVGELKAKHLLQIWLEHLFANAAGLELHTVSVSRHGKKAATDVFTPLSASEATTILSHLAQVYTDHCANPFCFPPEPALSFHSTMQSTGDFESAAREALTVWNAKEGTDLYWQRLFNLEDYLDTSFAGMVDRVFTPLSTHREKN